MKHIKKIATILSLGLALNLSGFVSLAADETVPADTAQIARYPVELVDCPKCGEPSCCDKREIERTFLYRYLSGDEGIVCEVYDILFEYTCPFCGSFTDTERVRIYG